MSCHRLDVQLTPDASWSFSSSVSQKSPLSTHSLLDWTLFLEWLVMAVPVSLSAMLLPGIDVLHFLLLPLSRSPSRLARLLPAMLTHGGV